MKLEELIGNSDVKRYLQRAIDEGRLGQALLFSGPEGVGKRQFAMAIARALLPDKAKVDSGNHPDIHVYAPEGKLGLHSIDAMRRLSEEVYMAPFEGPWKFFIIDDADRLNVYSANALLKTFEEPAENTIIILITSAPDALLPTILSRCRHVPFRPVGLEECQNWLMTSQGLDAKEAEQAATLAEGSLGRARRLAASDSLQRHQEVLELLEKPPQGYTALVAATQTLVSSIEERKKDEEGDARQEQIHSELNAIQRDAVEKEIAGQLSLITRHAVEDLFALILLWHRDAEALASGADPSHCTVLKNPPGRKVPTLRQCLKLIDRVRLMLQRSSPLQSCLEYLFLSLYMGPK